ncbi:carbonic anhydrase [Pluteus cervinus]|uniref:Carbonic anhydrase n=1 Tax=Pluteus cervinus TaxID=181527 RepID=A0ACD3AP27_9AGAR|nr:carbonic anhydrase [Pluteus cervinus]
MSQNPHLMDNIHLSSCFTAQRVSESLIFSTLPGRMFTAVNIANSSRTTLRRYAVSDPHPKHVTLMGHYGGGAMEIVNLRDALGGHLNNEPTPDAYRPVLRALVEENVKASIGRVVASQLMQEHFARNPDKPVFIHGSVYDGHTPPPSPTSIKEDNNISKFHQCSCLCGCSSQRHAQRCSPLALQLFLPMELLAQGNQEYEKDMHNSHPGLLHNLTKGQHPPFLLFYCSDSRLSDALIFPELPGNLFIVDDITSQNLRCPVKHTDVKHILLMGHYGCGGVQAAIHLPTSNPGLADNAIQSWIGSIREVYQVAFRALVGKNVKESVKRLVASEIIQEHFTSNQDRPVFIHGLVYAVENGKVFDLQVSQGPPGMDVPVVPSRLWINSTFPVHPSGPILIFITRLMRVVDSSIESESFFPAHKQSSFSLPFAGVRGDRSYECS